MKIKFRMVTCKHESKYGVDTYARILKKNDNINKIIKEIQDECDYCPDDENEYFDSDVKEDIINTDDFEIVE